MNEFNSFDSKRLETLKKTKELLDKYNNTLFDEFSLRNSMLKEMLCECGEDVTIQIPFKVLYGINTKIGNHVFINYNVNLLDGGEIIIGDRVLIGPDVKIYAGSHSLYSNERIVIENDKMKLISIPKKVVIENDVWICGNSTIVPGVTIGHDSVVAAGSVVTKDVKPYTLVGGNPAKVIKYLK